MQTFEINELARVAGDVTRIACVVESLPAIVDGKICIARLSDRAEGCWVDPSRMVPLTPAKHPFTGGTDEDKAWHDREARILRNGNRVSL